MVWLITVLVALVALVAGCTVGSGDKSPGASAPTTEAAPVAQITQNPAEGATDVSPVEPISVSVTNGTLTQVELTNPDGKVVQGVIRSTFVVDEEGLVQLAQYNVKATGHVAKLRRDLGLAS